MLEAHVLTAWQRTIVLQYCYYCGSVGLHGVPTAVISCCISG